MPQTTLKAALRDPRKDLPNAFRDLDLAPTVDAMNPHEKTAEILSDALGGAIDDVDLSLLADEVVDDLERRLHEAGAVNA